MIDNLEPKASIVDAQLVHDKAVSSPFVVKIVRPCDPDDPVFEIYDEGGLLYVYTFESEVGTHLRTLVGEEGTTYHKAYVVEGDQLGFEGEALDMYLW